MKRKLLAVLLAVITLCMMLTGCATRSAPNEALSSTTTTATTTTTTTVTKKPTTTTTTRVTVPANAIDVVKQGVDNTGKKDMTQKLTELHKTGKPIYYPNGTYLFNGKNLDFSGGVYFETQAGVVIRNSISDTPIVNFDDNGNLIGLMHNHLEYKYNQSGVDTIGNLVSPPVSKADYETKVDLLPYWYNDFGRYSQLVTSSGWKGWYDWSWNHHDVTQPDPYDSKLQPLLGFYRGDEPEVLDWICYWLREYGVNQATLVASGASKDRAGGDHWVYQLLNNTPNAQNMQFALNAISPDHFNFGYSTFTNSWDKMADWFYCNDQYKDQVYCYEKDGKRYPVVFVWNEKSIAFASGSTASGVAAFYQRYAEKFKQAGFDGVCIMARTVHSIFLNEPELLAKMEKVGIQWFATGYNVNATWRQPYYADTVKSFQKLSDSREWYTVATGLNTRSPHPSKWVCQGNTPALFGEWLRKAVDATVSDNNRAKIITCYNISEWAEGSSSMIPTVGDRFGYLEEVRNAIVNF